jgi:cysteine desulfurase family protein (TIGR01976 family)
MLDVSRLRQQFPALQHYPQRVYFDGPAGTQVPERVVDAVTHYLTHTNANHGGFFATSRQSDEILDAAHRAVADLLNAPSPEEIVFGPNMTALTLHLSRSIGKTLKPGDEVVVTRLDHDANVRPWVLAARDAGATVRWVDIHPEDCTLDLDDYRRQLGPRTRLVAVTCASNAVGTVTDVRTLTSWAHDAGARVFLDAVHYAPHGVIDVQEWGCDFLACSTYKFFGPHVGVLWGRRELLESLPAYKLEPAPETLPHRWMTGTQNHEGLAGVQAAVEYLADLGGLAGSRRERLVAGLTAVRAYEAELARHLLQALTDRPHWRVWGVRQPERSAERVPTVAVTHRGHAADALARHLADRQIQTWSGNLYALELTRRLGLEGRGGLLRLGLVHYNTAAEVDRLVRALDEVPLAA